MLLGDVTPITKHILISYSIINETREREREKERERERKRKGEKDANIRGKLPSVLLERKEGK